MDHIGRQTSIVVNGTTYTLSRFERRHVRKFLEWAETVLPHPLAVIKDHIKDFPLELQKEMVRDATQAARLKRSLNSPEVQSLMNSVEGAGRIITLLFQDAQPTLTEDEAMSLFEAARHELGDDVLMSKIAEASGVIPETDGSKKKAIAQT